MVRARQILMWLPRVAALALATLALGWVWTFGFTDFRSHQRGFMLGLAVVTLVYAALLAARSTWIVLSSVACSLIAGVVAICLLAISRFPNPVLLAVALTSLGYSSALGWALRVNRWNARIRDR
jgi:hypothetical protein